MNLLSTAVADRRTLLLYEIPPIPPGIITFAPGETTQLIAVPLLADAIAEPAETVGIALTDSSGATLGVEPHVTLTIDGGSKVYIPLTQRP
ncbi:MAG: hypothetical protein HGA45_31115 [Chloroflexales bacterium]|nr:hypothetical protein [Chloroflexales bacterium]